MGHRLADPEITGQAVHLAGFAPTCCRQARISCADFQFTLSLCDSEYARKWHMPSIGTARAHSLGR